MKRLRIVRLITLALAAITMAVPAATAGQSAVGSSPAEPTASAKQDADSLPVSLDKIKEALAQSPAEPLRGLNERPHFRLGVSEQTVSIEDLLGSLNFRNGPTVPGGVVNGDEVGGQAFPAVDNPLRQPYAAFNQGELLTIAIENLAAKYLGGRALNAVTSAERAHAEQAARDEVQQAIADYQMRIAQQTSTPER